ncbi:unnamed protein product [Hymenolepis diminuta]|uniref:Uncharacterized protein n=1 Tax=Hymenolepis diminuta TaxID=6216 RepID=A0A564Z0I6_HYMDI|nr:unnamed protein product [Hymenolepis diminuta]
MVYPKVNELATYPWPLNIVTDSAKSLQNYGRFYFDLISTNSFNMGSYILSGLNLPGSLYSMFYQDVQSITSTASFKILKLTIQNILSSFILFLHGEGPVFNANEDNPVVRGFCLCLRILYHVVMFTALFILPTFVISAFILAVICINFGFEFTIISAGCIVSFIIVNLVIRLWLHSQGTGDPSNQKNAGTVKKILQSTETAVHSLTDYIDSKIEEAESDSRSSNLFRRAIRWHLSLFNFYDRIFQPLIELRPDVVPLEPKEE